MCCRTRGRRLSRNALPGLPFGVFEERMSVLTPGAAAPGCVWVSPGETRVVDIVRWRGKVDVVICRTLAGRRDLVLHRAGSPTRWRAWCRGVVYLDFWRMRAADGGLVEVGRPLAVVDAWYSCTPNRGTRVSRVSSGPTATSGNSRVEPAAAYSSSRVAPAASTG